METTSIARGWWPATPWSVIRRGRVDPAERRAAVERLVGLYYVPVRTFLGAALRLSEGAAEDVAHDIFASLIAADFLEGMREERSFRGFLKLACRRRCANFRAAEAAARRALLRAPAPEPAAPADADLDALVDAELRRFYLAEARRRLAEDLTRRGKSDVLAIFDARARCEGARPEDYVSLAARFGLRIYDVQNRLAAARRIFRRELLAVAAECAEDAREELRELGLLRFIEADA